MNHSTGKAIGWVTPGVLDRGIEEYFRMVPSEVNLVFFTTSHALDMLHVGNFDKEAFAERRIEFVDAAKKLIAYHDVDCLAVTGDLIQSAMGAEWTKQLVHELEDATGKPVTTAMTAVTDALDHLGAQSVAVATPWRDDQNRHTRNYLESVGVRVAAISGFDTNGPQDILDLGPESPYTKALEVAEASGKIDAIYTACPLWHGQSDMIDRLEHEVGVPVLTFFNPILWRCLDLMDYERPVTGFGSLLAREDEADRPV